MSDRDYFEILGLPNHASPEAIDQAYWSRARENRASLDTDPDALLDLNEAYEVLRTPDLRERWEASRRRASAATPARSPSKRAVPALARQLPWKRSSAEERASDMAIMVGRLQAEVRAERERMRAVFDVDLQTEPDGDERSAMQRVFGRLRPF